MPSIVKIGNSQGIRIPKPILEQAHLENGEFEFVVTEEGLLLKPVSRKPREGWQEIVAQYSPEKDSALDPSWLDVDKDSEEWAW